MTDIRFQVAIAAYVFIGAMGLSFGMLLIAFLWALIRPTATDDREDSA